MKKMIKKLISVIAIICLMATSVVVFAEDSTAATKLDLTFKNIYNVGASSTASKSYTQTIGKTAMGIYVLPMPTLEPGQKIASYTYTYFTNIYGGSTIKHMTFPYEYVASDVTKLTTSSSEVAERISDSDSFLAATSSDVTVELLPIKFYSTSPSYKNTVDLTDYANECYNMGIRGSFMFAVRPTSGNTHFVPPAASDLSTNGYEAVAMYSVEEADPLAIVETTPENGAQSVASSTEVSFTYNNPINTASVTVNGIAADSTVNGATVKLNTALEQYTDYTVVFNAEDINGSTLETAISFTTGCNTIVTDEKTGGSSYVVSATGTKATGSGTTQLKFSDNNHFVLCKIPISDLKGKAIDYYNFTFVGNISNSIQTVKFPGEAWDLSTMTVNDESVMAIINNSSNYLAYDSYKVVNKARYIEQWTLDISSYARECVAANQDYMYLGFTAHGTTCAVYAYGSSYEPTWSYGINNPEFKTVEEVKIVAADNADGYDAKGLTVLSKGASYKAITSITNKTSENMTVVIAIADYNDDTLESVSLKTVEVKSGAFEKLIETDAITVSSGSTKAKAFLWKALGNEPYGENLEVMVQ